MLLSHTNPSTFPPNSLSLQQIFIDPLQDHMPASKRPKLSLQTSLPPVTYGVSSNQAGSNGADNMATPTTRNTLANQYHTFDLSIRPSPVSTIGSPAAAAAPFPRPGPISRNKRSLPYDLNLPIGKRSILKNSSIPTEVRRGSLSAATSTSPGSASGGRRVFFPEPKRVKFGTDEEIVTSMYTARHVDLSSSSEDEISLSGSDSGSDEAKEANDSNENAPATSKLLDRYGEAVIVDELQRGRSAGRSGTRRRTTRKKRRWEWTLGSLESEGKQQVVAGEESTTRDTPQPEHDADGEDSPSNASTSSSPSVTTPSTPAAAETKQPEVMVDEVVPTPTSATGELQQSEEETVSGP